MNMQHVIRVNGAERIIKQDCSEKGIIRTSDSILFFHAPNQGTEVFKNKINGKYTSLPFISE